MYKASEAMVEAENYADASRLLRHAILSLPKTVESDDIRHKLMMRLGYVKLLLAHQQRDAASANEASTMLVAYDARHRALFPNERERERTEIATLHKEAMRLAAGLTRVVLTTAPEHDAGTPQLTATEESSRSQSTGDGPRAATAAVRAADGDDEPEFRRDVRVPRLWFYDRDDPRVRARLESSFSDPGAGLVLTRVGYTVVTPPRPLVRAGGRPSRIGPPPPDDRDVRKLARGVLVASRPELRACYQDAVDRGGALESDVVVEFAVRSDGSVHDVQVVQGGVVDGLGDACVIEALSAARVSASSVAARLQLPLTFFYDGPGVMYEGGRDLERERNPLGIAKD